MDKLEQKLIIEALLFSHQGPLAIDKMIEVFDAWQRPSSHDVKVILEQLKIEYQERGIELVEVASGYRFQTKIRLSPWVSRLLIDKPQKYSKATLETLAIIAYKQPVTRGEIEDIRGVSVNANVIKTLIEREWIKIAGQKDVPGKPAIYVTTKCFLDYFNLKSLAELPTPFLGEAHSNLTAMNKDENEYKQEPSN